MLNFLRKIPYTPLQIAVHLYAWSALVMLIIDFFTHHLTANPIQAMEQRTGRHALTLLIMSLACTPLNTLFGWRELIKRRRALGLYALMYASVHVIIFMDLDYGLAWSLLIQTILEKWYILFGMTTFLLLLPLAITSFDIWKVRLGKNWKRLHQIVYYTAPIGVLHFFLSKKGDLFHLRGDIARPLIYGLVVIILLILRLPPIRRFFASLRTRVVFLFSKLYPQPKMDVQE
ncbi:MAG TPA: protein-methionine-sulfoxide reductase heme-binding subunit MsrQ [Anaerolineales bacterium]|nr:protein-methionine-sulfoxide reductase heme-binding subunit MsrQ [Anaerolineales bacterium]